MLSVTIYFLLFAHVICENTDKNGLEKRSNLHSSSTEVSASLLQEEGSRGDSDAWGELVLTQALGSSMEQELQDVIVRSNNLLNAGVARAHTTLALLLNHNLTEPKLPEDERLNKAMSYYLTAATKGDPLAQVVAGNNYLNVGDCLASLSYFHRAAEFSIEKIPEMNIINPSLVLHVWDEDGEIPVDEIPTQDQLEFFEHGAYHEEPEAALKAAFLLIAGPDNIQQDLVKGEKYLKQAAKGNITNAMVYLAQMYIRGIMEGSDETARKLLERALEYGNNLAHSGLGKLYMEGRGGLKQDLKRAEYHFKKGIETGNLDAFYQLGKFYFLHQQFGSIQEASELWKIPSTFGHVHSSWCLAEYYYDTLTKSPSHTLSSSSNTEVSTKLCEKAASLYRAVALSGEWRRLFQEAFIDYTAGRKEAALIKYLLLSDLGYKAAHINAARILDEGTNEIYLDAGATTRQAYEMWRRTAESNNPKGYVRMADYLYYGMVGKGRDYMTALYYYKKALLMKDVEGGFSYALLTEWGEGVKQNIDKAEKILKTLIEINQDATVPVALVLTRIKLFKFVNETFSTNLYSWNWATINATNVSLLFKNFYLQWDIYLMLFLSWFILVKLYLNYR